MRSETSALKLELGFFLVEACDQRNYENKRCLRKLLKLSFVIYNANLNWPEVCICAQSSCVRETSKKVNK